MGAAPGAALPRGPWEGSATPGTARDKDRDVELPSFPPWLSWSCQQPNSLDSTLASAALGANFSSKKFLRENVPQAEPVPAGRGPQLSPSWGSIQGCSHWEQWDPGAALVGEFVPGMFETLLKDERAGSARAEPSPSSQFGSVKSRGVSGMAGMAPTLSLEPFPQLQRDVEPPPAVALLLRLRGWIPVLPLLPQDGVTWSGPWGGGDPAGQRNRWDPAGSTLGAGNQCGIQLGEQGQGI